MKKLLSSLVLITLLTACNPTNGGGNAENGVSNNPADSTQISNRSDTTSTSNSDAYNTTDTGASKGTTIDSSGKHSSERNGKGSGRAKSRKP